LLQPLLCNTSEDNTRKTATSTIASQIKTIILAVQKNDEASNGIDVQTVLIARLDGVCVDCWRWCLC
jgi:hypothetical protein